MLLCWWTWTAGETPTGHPLIGLSKRQSMAVSRLSLHMLRRRRAAARNICTPASGLRTIAAFFSPAPGTEGRPICLRADVSHHLLSGPEAQTIRAAPSRTARRPTGCGTFSRIFFPFFPATNLGAVLNVLHLKCFSICACLSSLREAGAAGPEWLLLVWLGP